MRRTLWHLDHGDAMNVAIGVSDGNQVPSEPLAAWVLIELGLNASEALFYEILKVIVIFLPSQLTCCAS